MSTYVPVAHPVVIASDAVRAETRPPAKGGPVLMADCATPLAGETLLSLLWRRWDQET